MCGAIVLGACGFAMVAFRAYVEVRSSRRTRRAARARAAPTRARRRAQDWRQLSWSLLYLVAGHQKMAVRVVCFIGARRPHPSRADGGVRDASCPISTG